MHQEFGMAVLEVLPRAWGPQGVLAAQPCCPAALSLGLGRRNSSTTGSKHIAVRRGTVAA